MRKITLLFASLFLVMGSAWAQITSLADFKQDKCYTFSTPSRGGWAVREDGSQFASTNDCGWGTTVDATNKNQQFAVYSVNGTDYYLYSIGAGKFVKADRSLVDMGGDALAMTAGTGDYAGRARFNFRDYANSYINIGGSNQMSVDWWNDIDGGNAIAVAEAGDLDAQMQALIKTKIEIFTTIIPARAAVEGASNSRVGAYTFDAVYDLSEALDAYDKEETTDNFNAVKNAYEALVAGGEKVELTAGEIFTVKCLDTNRGYMAYSTIEGKGSETKAYLAGTNKAEYHPAADAEGAYTEWAIATKDNKNYIYNVKNGKYITPVQIEEGGNTHVVMHFTENPCAFDFIALDGALWELQFEYENRFLSFSPGWGDNAVRAEGGVDDGCKFYLDKTGFEVSPAEIIFPEWDEEYVMLEQYGQTIQFAVEFTPVDAAQAVTWSSSNPELVAIDAETGLAEVVGYTPQGYEMVNITATLADGTKLTLEIAVAVAQEVVEGGIAKIELYSTYREMNAVGDTIHLSPIAYDAEGNVVETSFYYLCEGEGLTDQVTVDFMTGVVTVWEGYAGTVIVTVMDMEGTASATCYLSIYAAGAGNDAKLWEIYLSRFTFPNEYAGDKPFEVGDTYQLTVTFDPENFEDQRLSWTSDDEDVVTVDENGKITAVGVGEATITVTALANPDDEYCTKTCTVTVVAKTTGINAVEADAETVIYDLTGRRVEKMQKGIYIVNGKKVLVK